MISSTSHQILVSMNKDIQSANDLNSGYRAKIFAALGQSEAENLPNYAEVSLALDNVYLTTDFILNVQAKGLDTPTCVLEPISPSKQEDSHALMLTLTPRFSLKEIRSELIFIVDRSGSMTGENMIQTQNALHAFLRGIPKNSFFNIIGFGSRLSLLFNKSVEFNEETFFVATKYAEEMSADLGGTEIRNAMNYAFSNRQTDLPTQIFLLTDGMVSNIDDIVSDVQINISKSKENFVRVFTLGIGNGVSRNLVESVARAGEGYSQYVVAGERMERKVLRMLKNAILPPMTDYQIEWPDVLENSTENWQLVSDPKNLKIFDEYSTSSFVPSRLMKSHQLFHQAPFHIPPLYSGSRYIVCGLFTGKIKKNLEGLQIKIRGSSPDGPIELEVPVTLVKPGIIIHTITARKLIQDLEEGTSCIHFANSGIELSRLSDVVKSKIVNLGTKFSIASSFTSFVAIDNNGNSISAPRQSTTLFKNSQSGFGGSASSIFASAQAFGSTNFYVPKPFDAVHRLESLETTNVPTNFSTSSGFRSIAKASAEKSTTSLFGATPINNFASTPFGNQATKTSGTFNTSPAREKYRPLDQKITPDFRSAHSFSASGNYFDAAFPPISFSDEFGASLIEKVTFRSEHLIPESKAMRSDKNANPIPDSRIETSGFSFSRKKSLTETNDGLLYYAPTITTKTDILLDQKLIRLQLFDGSFAITEALVSFIWTTIDGVYLRGTEVGIAETLKTRATFEAVWASMIAMAIFKLNFEDSNEDWELLYEKTSKFVMDEVKKTTNDQPNATEL
ncbi:hypothetical protein HK096_004926, partial [Nowakowskiella sp. JEL0078]